MDFSGKAFGLTEEPTNCGVCPYVSESAWDDLSFDISISPDSDVILGYVDRPRRQIRWENTIEETTLMTWANRQAATIAAHIPETIDLGVKELALKKKLCKIWPKGKEKLYHFLDEQSMLPTTTICGFARSQFQALLYVDETGTSLSHGVFFTGLFQFNLTF